MVYHSLHTIYNGEKIKVSEEGISNYKDISFRYLYHMKTKEGLIIIAETKSDGKIISYCKNRKEISDALNAINSDSKGPFTNLIRNHLEESLIEA